MEKVMKWKPILLVSLALVAGLGLSSFAIRQLSQPRAPTIQIGDYSDVVGRYDAAMVLFTLEGCPYCEMAKAHLKENQVKYREVPLEESAKDRAFFLEAFGQRGVPVLVSAEAMLVGYDTLKVNELLAQQVPSP